MGSALTRGRTLNPRAVALARKQREDRINMLKANRANGTATIKELRELRWKWGVRYE